MKQEHFTLRPASREEAGHFYSDEGQDEVLGTVGHLRMDFGSGGKRFHHTWWPHNGDRFNTPEFKEVLQQFVEAMRKDGPLKDLSSMSKYCRENGGTITEDDRVHGYIAETEHYRFCLRCTPRPGDYQGYLYIYDLRQQELARQDKLVGRVTYASGECQEFTDPEEYLNTIREELPYRNTTGFRHETLTDDPQVRKAVDDILLDFAGEENPRRACSYGLTASGIKALGLTDGTHVLELVKCLPLFPDDKEGESVLASDYRQLPLWSSVPEAASATDACVDTLHLRYAVTGFVITPIPSPAGLPEALQGNFLWLNLGGEAQSAIRQVYVAGTGWVSPGVLSRKTEPMPLVLKYRADGVTGEGAYLPLEVAPWEYDLLLQRTLERLKNQARRSDR